MPTARLNDSTMIHYEILGHEGPWIAAISSGRGSLADMEPIAGHLASRGYRVIVHDRRNCGRSSLSFDFPGTEDDTWADDLGELLNCLDIPEVFLVGLSRGARVALRFALRHPDRARGLLLWGISGGATAARFLDDFYYGRYLRACEAGGMDAVCALDHFAGLAAARPENRTAILAMDPLQFFSTMTRWRAQFMAGVRNQVIGMSDDELRRVSTPTAIVPYTATVAAITAGFDEGLPRRKVPRSRRAVRRRATGGRRPRRVHAVNPPAAPCRGSSDSPGRAWP